MGIAIIMYKVIYKWDHVWETTGPDVVIYLAKYWLYFCHWLL